MKQKLCRCCGGQINGRPILKYSNMPGMAQNFPDAGRLSEDKGMELDLYQCSHCGLMQILGDPVPYYRDVIRAAAVSEEMKAYRLQYFKEFVDRYGLAGKRVLEVGAGKGEYLELMAQAGVQAYGIEHGREAVQVCLSHGLSVTQEFIESAKQKLADGPFDGFFIMNFLEHIPGPNGFLQGICNNLSDGAFGLVEVPNMDFILDNAVFSEFIADHLMYFTSGTLKLLLEKNGFEVLECKAVWHDYCLAAIVRKRQPLKLHHFYEKQERIARDLNQFIDTNREAGKRVAVWGAGHQALAVVALSGIKDKIEFVVDSAPFKQNKYTPGTHVPIVDPGEILRKGIGAVIVMAASYSDEVASILQKEYPNVVAAILREQYLEVLK